MMARRSSETEVGRCPSCGTALATTDVLISYEATTERRHWVDCPSCQEVVHPTSG